MAEVKGSTAEPTSSASDFLSVGSQLFGGFMRADGLLTQSRNEAANLRATGADLRRRAVEEYAISTLKSAEAKRRADLIKSRALAVAAAQGAAVDADVLNVMADLDAEGKLASRVAIYDGMLSRRNLERQAQQADLEAQQREAAGQRDALSTILGTALSIGALLL